MEELTKGIESCDYRRAFEAAHGLKGDTGNLSLTPLYEAVCLLVEDLRPAYAGASVRAGLADDYARVLALFAEFTEKAVARISKLKQGQPSDESTEIGCLISEAAAVKVKKQIPVHENPF